MGNYTKIPQATFDELQLDAGILLKNFNPAQPHVQDSDIICATTGGFTATCKPSFEDMGSDVDNCPANTKQLKKVTDWEAGIETSCLGTSPATLKMALGCADIDSDDATHIIPRKDLKQDDFKDIWWVGDKANGGYLACVLHDALSTDGVSLKTTKNGKGQFGLKLTGHFDIDNQDRVPMDFYSVDPAPSDNDGV